MPASAEGSGHEAESRSAFPVQYGSAAMVPGEMLRLGVEFRRLREGGVKHVGRYLVLVTLASGDGSRKCGIICGKSYSRSAVERNRARRLLKEAFRLVKNCIVGVQVGLIPRQAMRGKGLAVVQEDLIRQLRRAGCWHPDREDPGS